MFIEIVFTNDEDKIVIRSECKKIFSRCVVRLEEMKKSQLTPRSLDIESTVLTGNGVVPR